MTQDGLLLDPTESPTSLYEKPTVTPHDMNEGAFHIKGNHVSNRQQAPH